MVFEVKWEIATKNITLLSFSEPLLAPCELHHQDRVQRVSCQNVVHNKRRKEKKVSPPCTIQQDHGLFYTRERFSQGTNQFDVSETKVAQKVHKK